GMGQQVVDNVGDHVASGAEAAQQQHPDHPQQLLPVKRALLVVGGDDRAEQIGARIGPAAINIIEKEGAQILQAVQKLRRDRLSRLERADLVGDVLELSNRAEIFLGHV